MRRLTHDFWVGAMVGFIVGVLLCVALRGVPTESREARAKREVQEFSDTLGRLMSEHRAAQKKRGK